MKKIKNIAFLLSLLISLLGCKKQWDKDINPQYLQNGGLYDLIRKDPDLTQFMSLAKKAGYDSVLRRVAPYTVLAVKNGGFSNVDTGNLVTVKKVIGIHILPSAFYRENMSKLRTPAISGKYVRFETSSGVITANSIEVTGNGDRAVNGVVYKVATAIIPLPSIYEIISSNPNYSLYYQYIQKSFVQSFDPVNNIIIRYDSIGKPVYKQPYNYIYTSPFIGYSKIDSEKVEQTVFIPTNAVVTKVLGLMLSSRGGNQSLVIPAITQNHPEMNVGGYYFPTNFLYPGDSTIVQNYLFRNTIINGIISRLANGNNTFISKDGNPYIVSSTQVAAEGLASNGKYYVINDVNLPGSSYRKTFMFDPRVDLLVIPMVAAVGAKTTNVVVNSGTAIDRANQFDFGNTNGKLTFTFPYVTAGKYQVVLRYVSIASGATLSISYNGIPLIQNLDTSTLFGSGQSIDTPLSVINLPADGQVPLTFQCVAPGSQNGSLQMFKFNMNTIRLVPVD